MADEHSHSRVELYDSGLTVPSDSEIYSANHEVSSPMSASSSPLILYKPPSIWGILRGAAINLILPFVNGLMLGFGELFAHEAAFRLGWSNTKEQTPAARQKADLGAKKSKLRQSATDIAVVFHSKTPSLVNHSVSPVAKYCNASRGWFEGAWWNSHHCSTTFDSFPSLQPISLSPNILLSGGKRISSFRPQSSRFPVRYGGPTQTLSGKISWKPASSIPGVMAARFNSTSSVTDATASEHLSGAPTDTGVPGLSDLSAADLSSIPEHIGYLKDLGLDYGWGPSSIIQFFIEHIHIWGGLPWWASVVGTGILLRLALLYPTLGAVDTSTKMLNIKPVTEPLRQQMIMRGKEGNQIEMLKLRAEIQKLHQEQGIVAWKSFIPMLQIPFGFGCYRVVKGMAALPVPGLTLESVAWLKDLTVADPYFILPAASALFMYLSIRKGGENGVNQLQGTALGRLLMFGLPALSFLFMAFFPSALQLYFVTTGLFGLGQAYLLSSDTFRKSMNIALPVRQPKNGQSPGRDDSQQSKSIRILREHLETERAKMIQEQHKSPNSLEISFIDRALNNLKEAKENIKRETAEKLDAVRGQAPVKNADGTIAEPPRLGEKDLKLAADYERRRKEEEDWKREERNHARREAHLKAMELEREKARSAFKVKQR
ncbi:hypothetical protein LV164_003700 [Aspergillus fumigatus]|nr:hypothetical protein KXX42_002111 [Aspergillus fumigatus]KAH1546782.1 hypothetical protein KXX57_003178 [Aspergillus fumigatus]KAH1976095.1 hypothetical protein KXW88_009346 [Aspergillus fumigatus]KAH2308606.1 hypothetical protein KXV47_006443 [Aspergillus fumigatus]KAH2671330.1 hypothetical protein KXV32_002323 [Aspergillus fumigatus]